MTHDHSDSSRDTLALRPTLAALLEDGDLNDLAVADDHHAWSWRTPRLVARMSGQP